jgi:branched-subunit amino acid aminotransferase/4-amino-4-deoxychorismate lyase
VANHSLRSRRRGRNPANARLRRYRIRTQGPRKLGHDFNFDYTRTTFITFAYPYTDRDSNEIVAEWTNLITLTSKDRLTAGMLFHRISGTEVASIDHAAEDAGGSRPGAASTPNSITSYCPA